VVEDIDGKGATLIPTKLIVVIFEKCLANNHKPQALGSSPTKLYSAKRESTFSFGHPRGLFQRPPALTVEFLGFYLRRTDFTGRFILLLLRVPRSCRIRKYVCLILTKPKIQKSEIPCEFVSQTPRLGRCGKQ
jgi:hypothetical protein